jgi:hypothetical protein
MYKIIFCPYRLLVTLITVTHIIFTSDRSSVLSISMEVYKKMIEMASETFLKIDKFFIFPILIKY